MRLKDIGGRQTHCAAKQEKVERGRMVVIRHVPRLTEASGSVKLTRKGLATSAL